MWKLQDLVSNFENKRKLAKKLKIHPSNITKWQTRGVPPIKLIEIEKITKGKYKACNYLKVI